MSNLIDVSVLTDDPDYADKQNSYALECTKLDRYLTDTYNLIRNMKLGDKQKICDGIKEITKEVKQ